MEFERLAKDFKEVFDREGFTWKIDGELTVPSEQDILDTLNQMAAHMDEHPDGTQMELGHLIFIKSGRFVDVYMHHGTIERPNEQSNTEPVL